MTADRQGLRDARIEPISYPFGSRTLTVRSPHHCNVSGSLIATPFFFRWSWRALTSATSFIHVSPASRPQRGICVGRPTKHIDVPAICLSTRQRANRDGPFAPVGRRRTE